MTENYDSLVRLAAPRTGYSKNDTRSTIDATRGAISNKQLMGGSRGVHIELYKLQPLMGDTGSKVVDTTPPFGKGLSSDSSMLLSPMTGGGARLNVADPASFMHASGMLSARQGTFDLSNNLSNIQHSPDNWNSFVRDFPDLK